MFVKQGTFSSFFFSLFILLNKWWFLKRKGRYVVNKHENTHRSYNCNISFLKFVQSNSNIKIVNHECCSFMIRNAHCFWQSCMFETFFFCYFIVITCVGNETNIFHYSFGFWEVSWYVWEYFKESQMTAKYHTNGVI